MKNAMLRFAVLVSFGSVFFLASSFGLKASGWSVEEWISRAKKSESLKISPGNGEGICRQWLERHPDVSGQNRPAFVHFNGAFFGFAKNQSGDSVFVADEAIAAALNLFVQTENPAYLEMAGDLLLMYPERPDLHYLGAMAYLRASEFAKSESSKIAWERKAIFAMENPILGPGFYDKIRFFRFRQAYLRSKKAGELLMESEMKAPLDFWPAEKSPFSLFAEEQLSMDRAEERKLVPSNEISLPGVDPKEVKRNVRYNLYAIFVLLALFGTVGYMIWRFRKEARKLDLEDQSRS